ncbi:hypothetical protein [Stieleria varia]|uniref:Uncharacterized protein n=1 Tax=Stieleria varia TaxID=2528005 RepID=A0A5C6B9K0_9BACT|nr:hypothetical protein [Stieleria varia]TWU08397.1 hypothetical protein Pla52n_09800 [Stieleria varia]
MSMQNRQSEHLATIAAVAPRTNRARLLSTRWLLVHAIVLVLWHTSWLAIVMLTLWLCRATPASSPTFAAFLLLLGIAFQVTLSRSYPEWPLNRFICWRLRRILRRREPTKHFAWSPQSGDCEVVELIPRSRWQGGHLDNAIDVMVAKVADGRLQMLGDQSIYDIPGQSIVDLRFDDVVLRGWMTPTFMVVLTVETSDGLVELPLARRDFRWGQLRASRRRAETIAWCGELSAIASGCGPSISPWSTPQGGGENIMTPSYRNPYHPTVATSCCSEPGQARAVQNSGL